MLEAMPDKQNVYRSYGEKLISLFARLLFSGESYSLTELSRMLECSKQTVLRLVENIHMAYGVELEELFQGNRKYFRIKKPAKGTPVLCLTEMEMNVLSMCRAFAEHLLGRKQFEEATQALLKTSALLSQERKPSLKYFASFRPGTIDYTPHHETMRTLIQAMEERRVCKLIYRATYGAKSKTFYIKPLKIFSHKDTVYLHARLARTPGKPYKEPDFDPLLAVHRINEVEMTDKLFEFPKDYDFEKVFNREFGVIKDKAFEVEVQFKGWAAKYVTERTWSPNQKIIEDGSGKIRLSFVTASEEELTAWLLSFGEEAILLKPRWLVKKVKEKIESLHKAYLQGSSEVP